MATVCKLMDAIAELRREHPGMGVKKLVKELQSKHPDWEVHTKAVREALDALATEKSEAAKPSPPPDSVDELQQRLQRGVAVGADARIKDGRMAEAAADYGTMYKSRCDHCGVTAKEKPQLKFRSCAGCGVYYCGETCQKDAWPSHKKHCRTTQKMRAQPIDAALTLVSITPCDATGLYQMSAVVSQVDGYKYAAAIHIRLGHGVQRAFQLPPKAMSEQGRDLDLAEFERILYSKPDFLFTGLSPMGVRISCTEALSLLNVAEEEKRTPTTFKAAVKVIRDGATSARSAAGQVDSEGVMRHYRDMLADFEVSDLITRITPLGLERLPKYLMVQLETLEKALLPSVKMPRAKFDASHDITTCGYQDEQIRDISAVLELYNRDECESAGGLRMRYKLVCQFLAAWLQMARSNDLLGVPPPELLKTLRKDELCCELMAVLAYVAGVQCSGQRMFSSGLFRPAVAGEIPEDDDEEIYRRNTKTACCFVIAMGLRYHVAHGRPRVPMNYSEGHEYR